MKVENMFKLNLNKLFFFREINLLDNIDYSLFQVILPVYRDNVLRYLYSNDYDVM